MFTDDRTQAHAAVDDLAPPSRTRTIEELLEEVGNLRSRHRLLHDNVTEATRRMGEVHHRAFDSQLNTRARDLARRSATELLDQLSNWGFAWRDIARLIGVSVPAVRRWRHGEPPTGTNLLGLARVNALVDILRGDHLVSEVASWMEIPLTPEAPITPIDLAAAGHHAEVLDIASGHSDPEEVLDRLEPEWRRRFASEVEVFEASDGELGIRPLHRERD